MASRTTLALATAAFFTTAVIIAFFSREYFNLDWLIDSIRSLGSFAIPVFILGYLVAVVGFLPATLISIAAGAVFGPAWGTLYSVTGATLGSGLAFLLSRYFLSDWIKQKGGRHSKKMMHCVEVEAWRFVAFVRLVPLFPFNLSNYLFGVTSLSLFSFIWPTALFIIPGTLARTYIGHIGLEALQDEGNQIVVQIGVAAAVVGITAFLPSIIKTVRREMMKPEPPEESARL